MTTPAAEITDRLVELADELEGLDARREAIYRERLDLWLKGRRAPYRLLQKELAVPSRVTVGAVTQALRKHAQNGRGR